MPSPSSSGVSSTASLVHSVLGNPSTSGSHSSSNTHHNAITHGALTFGSVNGTTHKFITDGDATAPSHRQTQGTKPSAVEVGDQQETASRPSRQKKKATRKQPFLLF